MYCIKYYIKDLVDFQSVWDKNATQIDQFIINWVAISTLTPKYALVPKGSRFAYLNLRYFQCQYISEFLSFLQIYRNKLASPKEGLKIMTQIWNTYY